MGAIYRWKPFHLLHEVAVWLCSGLNMMIDFNVTLQVFIAKGDDTHDSVEVMRDPSSTRPLGLKNTDNKIIAGAVHHSIKRAVSVGASPLQRRFVSGRNFINNIVDLDSKARLFSMKPDSFMPVLLFTDFGAAFPSIIHEWLMIIMEQPGFPAGLRNRVQALYPFVMAVGRSDGATVTLFIILAGVIQGCPLASFCFLIAFDPF